MNSSIVGRARFRAAHVDPEWKRRIREWQHRNPTIDRRLIAAIDEAEGPILGVGMFSMAVARRLARAKVDIVDSRPWNVEANLFADLPSGTAVLGGPYGLIVSQDALGGAEDVSAVVESLSGHLDGGGRMIVVLEGRTTTFRGVTRVRRSLRQTLWSPGAPPHLLDRPSS